MKDITYSISKLVREKVDNTFSRILTQNDGVSSFSKVLDTILKDLSVLVEDSAKDTQLAVKMEKNNGVKIVISLYFYFCTLIQNNLLKFFTTGCQETSVEIGDDTLQGFSPGYLPEEISTFIRIHIVDNICISPEFKDYIEAGRVSLELFEARKNTKIAIISSCAAVVSAIFAIIAVICEKC